MSIETFLTNMRLAIIGDDEIKEQLCQSPQFKDMLTVLDQLINEVDVDQEHLEMLGNILVILNSLTYYRPKLLHDYNAMRKLVLVIVKYQNDDKILNSAFKCLMNLASNANTNNSTLHLDSEIGQNFTALLNKKLNEFEIVSMTQGSLYLQILKLLPHLNPLTTKFLLPSLLSILKSLLEKPQEYLLNKYRYSDIYLKCFEQQLVPNSPPTSTLSNLLPPLLYSISHLLSHEKPSQNASSSTNADPATGLFPNEEDLRIDELIETNLYFTLTSLMKVNSQDLKLAAITVLVSFSLYSNLPTSSKICNVKKLLPVLIQLIDSFEKNKETLNSFKSEYKHSKNFNPFYILSKLCLEFEFVHEFLISCGIIKKISDFLKNVNQNQSIDEVTIERLDNLSDFFLILSSITADNESNRKLIVNNDLIEIVEKILRNHLRILKRKIISNQNKKGLQLLSVSNHLTLSAIYLLRSLSRSVSVLRISLYENELVPCLLELIQVNEEEMETSMRQLSADEVYGEILTNEEVLLKSVVLSVLSNFVLDFTPLRDMLLHENDLLSDVSTVLETTKHPLLKRNSLWCLRHVLFNQKDEMKDEFLKVITLDRIFGYILGKENDEAIQNEALAVVRNLTCDSKHLTNKILSYKPTPDFDLVDCLSKFLVQGFKNDKVNSPLLENTLFIIVNMASMEEDARDRVASRIDILQRIKELLQSKRVSEEAKRGSIWTIINLTWIENTEVRNEDDTLYDEPMVFGVDDVAVRDEEEEVVIDRAINSDTETEVRHVPDAIGVRRRRQSQLSARRRTQVLNQLGFVDVLNKLMDDTSNEDLKERVKTCVFNLNRFSS